MVAQTVFDFGARSFLCPELPAFALDSSAVCAMWRHACETRASAEWIYGADSNCVFFHSARPDRWQFDVGVLSLAIHALVNVWGGTPRSYEGLTIQLACRPPAGNVFCATLDSDPFPDRDEPNTPVCMRSPIKTPFVYDCALPVPSHGLRRFSPDLDAHDGDAEAPKKAPVRARAFH